MGKKSGRVTLSAMRMKGEGELIQKTLLEKLRSIQRGHRLASKINLIKASCLVKLHCANAQ